MEGKKSLRRNSEVPFLIWRRKHFQSENKHHLLFIHYENKAWCSGKKMGFIIQMTCIPNLALTLTICE